MTPDLLNNYLIDFLNDQNTMRRELFEATFTH